MTPAMLVLFRVRFILELKPLSRPLRTAILITTIYLCVVILVFTLYDTHLCFIIQSMLPGQRLSACTCPGESHPGRKRHDGSYVGRFAPHIDPFAVSVARNQRSVSHAAQLYPFTARW